MSNDYVLRPYQEQCIANVFRELETVRSTLVVMATGLGKTVVFVTAGRRWTKGRVLVLAHRKELIQQAVEKIYDITGEMAEIEKAEQRVDRKSKCKWVVGSVQTLRGERLAKLDPHSFGLVIIDEAHHSVASTYRDIINHFRKNPDCKILGVTATPERADELAMGQVFDTVAFNLGIEVASEEGWLVPLLQRVVRIEELDFSKCRTLAGDFNEADLEALVNEEKMLHKVAAPTVELAGSRSSLVFCVSVAHAERMAEILNRYKPHSAAFLCGKTHDEERDRTIRQFKSGQLQFLCNVGVLLEGFDAPNCSCIAMARPTKSLLLYTQVLGRVTRSLPGVIDALSADRDARLGAIRSSAKPNSLILDFAGNAGKHKIITAADVLGGKYGEPVKAHACKNAEEDDQGLELEASFRRAADELEWLKELEDIKRQKALETAARAKVKAEAEYHTYAVSLYAGGVASGSSAASGGATPEPATKNQIKWLVWQGIPRKTAEGYTKKQASGVIGRIKADRDIA